MVEKVKRFSWLKLWHSSKKSSGGDTVDNDVTHHNQHKHGNHGLKNILATYGRRGWIRHWKLLHLDKRSCAQSKDVCTEGPFHSHVAKQDTIRAHLARPMLDKSQNCAQKRNNVPTLEVDERTLLKRNNSMVNVKEGMHSSGRSGSGDLDIISFELQQYKSGLKNRVLPLTAQEEMSFSVAFKLKTALNSINEDCPISEATMELEPEAHGLKGPLVSKKKSLSRMLSTPASPQSTSEAKWKVLLSCSSQVGSLRSPGSPDAIEWASPVHESAHQKGSLSTMGSPWNSQAGGNRFRQANRATSFKGSYKQGQWVTTDDDFVVLEL